MTSSDAFVELREPGAVGWVRQDLAPLGLAAFWRTLEPLADAKGRGGVGVLAIGDEQVVVRPYRRGGAFGHLLRDRYASPVRAERELKLLVELAARSVPVVEPVAAVAMRRGPFWRLRLCTRRFRDGLPLPAFLAQRPELRGKAVAAAADVVARAFALGLVHPDLHPDNLLCRAEGDQVQVVLVDLDRARLRPPLRDGLRFAMLVRMQRYVLRHADRLAAVPTRRELMRFLRGVCADRTARHALWRRLAVQLAGIRPRSRG